MKGPFTSTAVVRFSKARQIKSALGTFTKGGISHRARTNPVELIGIVALFAFTVLRGCWKEPMVGQTPTEGFSHSESTSKKNQPWVILMVGPLILPKQYPLGGGALRSAAARGCWSETMMGHVQTEQLPAFQK